MSNLSWAEKPGGGFGAVRLVGLLARGHCGEFGSEGVDAYLLERRILGDVVFGDKVWADIGRVNACMRGK